jgi:hypothetical protein
MIMAVSGWTGLTIFACGLQLPLPLATGGSLDLVGDAHGKARANILPPARAVARRTTGTSRARALG